MQIERLEAQGLRPMGETIMDHATALERLFEARQRIEELERGILAEREACAKIADSFTSRNPENTMTQDSLSEVAEDIASAIRARNASQG